MINSCNKVEDQKYKISSEEYLTLEKFFRYVMLFQAGIFTLLGSKPLTKINIIYYDYANLTDEEKKQFEYYFIDKKDENDLKFYKTLSKEERKKVQFFSKKNNFFQIDKIWDDWEKINNRLLLSNKYLLVKKERSLSQLPAHSKHIIKIYDVYFVNILQTSLIIQKYYEVFKKIVGTDFDVLTLIYDLKNDDSVFWNKIQSFEYSYIWGLLFGYGFENSYLYYWKYKNIDNDSSPFFTEFSKSIMKRSSNNNLSFLYNIKNFPLPYFSSFSTNDPIIEKYKKERKEIQSAYQRKDFVYFTLKLLTNQN